MAIFIISFLFFWVLISCLTTRRIKKKKKTIQQKDDKTLWNKLVSEKSFRREMGMIKEQLEELGKLLGSAINVSEQCGFVIADDILKECEIGENAKATIETIINLILRNNDIFDGNGFWRICSGLLESNYACIKIFSKNEVLVTSLLKNTTNNEDFYNANFSLFQFYDGKFRVLVLTKLHSELWSK